ncbi:hypothetical protein GCM10011506_37330 [Marivirga lumbricoides]|uniref:SPOR domain-containing protein n=2 Tax=Marivirga lumbricoides TaxID=1046115 RepID=A0ABQ1N007_9BACT|nr:hypothetical protein GCM10011506_37330 [Marivirga lumbricoides]
MKKNEMKRVFFTLLLCVTFVMAKAQLFPVPSQYFTSPYTINPAYAGLEGYTYIQLIHKQQWLGIEGAPALSNVGMQFPVSRKFNVGGNFFYDQNGLIKSMSGMLSANYVIPFSPVKRLSIGLSGGAFNTEYDLGNSANPDDPAIANFDGAYNPILSFGLVYHTPKFHVGVSLPSLLGNSILNPEIAEKPEETFYQHLNFTAGLKLGSANGLAFEPSAVYKMEEGVEDYMEFSGILNFSEAIYVGGAFRPDYGPTILFGFNAGPIRFGYAYEMAGEQVEQLGQGSHEVLLGFRIGKKKSYAVKEPPEPKPLPKKVEKPAPPKEKVEEPEVVKEIPPADTIKVEKPSPRIKSDPVPQKAEPKVEPQPEPEPKDYTYYVIIGAFNDLENALEYVKEMEDRGFKNVNQIYNAKSRLTYVYILRTKDIDEARSMRMVMRQTEGFDETWIYENEE